MKLKSSNLEQAQHFSITVSTPDLEVCIAKCTSILDASSVKTGTYFLHVSDEKVYTSILGVDSFACINLPHSGVIDGSPNGCFGFTPDKMLSLIKGRGLLKLSLTENNECLIQQQGKSSFKATLFTVSLSKETGILFNTLFGGSAKDLEGSNLLARETVETIKDSVLTTTLHEVYLGTSKPALLSNILLDSNKIMVSSSDNYHWSILEGTVAYEGSPLHLSIPDKVLTILDKLSAGSTTPVSFSANDAKISSQGSNFIVQLPLLQSHPYDFDAVPNFFKENKKFHLESPIDIKKLAALLENMTAIQENSSTFDLTYKDGSSKLRATCKSPMGSVSDTLRLKPVKSCKSFIIQAEPKLLKDILDKAKELTDTRIIVILGKCLMIRGSKKGGDVTLLCAITSSDLE